MGLEGGDGATEPGGKGQQSVLNPQNQGPSATARSPEKVGGAGAQLTHLGSQRPPRPSRGSSPTGGRMGGDLFPQHFSCGITCAEPRGENKISTKRSACGGRGEERPSRPCPERRPHSSARRQPPPEREAVPACCCRPAGSACGAGAARPGLGVTHARPPPSAAEATPTGPAPPTAHNALRPAPRAASGGARRGESSTARGRLGARLAAPAHVVFRASGAAAATWAAEGRAGGGPGVRRPGDRH